MASKVQKYEKISFLGEGQVSNDQDYFFNLICLMNFFLVRSCLQSSQY